MLPTHRPRPHAAAVVDVPAADAPVLVPVLVVPVPAPVVDGKFKRQNEGFRIPHSAFYI